MPGAQRKRLPVLGDRGVNIPAPAQPKGEVEVGSRVPRRFES
jgi:hypothetical protein